MRWYDWNSSGRPNSNKAYELFGGAASLSCGTDMDALFLHKDPDPMPKLNRNQEDRANSRCHGNIVCPGDIALVVTGASFTTTGEMKNSQFSFSGSQPLYMNPPPPHPPTHRLASISPSLSHSSTHLMQTKPARLSPCSLKETPNANLGKLFIVCRQLPPGFWCPRKLCKCSRRLAFWFFSFFFFNTEENTCKCGNAANDLL